jgi:L-rhamnonate dehydratase
MGKFNVEVEMKRIKEVRVYVVKGGGADYHDQSSVHWISAT